MNENEEDREHEDKSDKEKAAHGDSGQDQKPVQSQEEDHSTTWDTAEHSDAPGPTGTGEE